MAEKELAILVTAKDLASRTIGKVSREVGGLGKVSKTVGHGLSSLAGNLAKVGAVAAVGIGAAVKGGLDSLATLENATTAVDGAIKQMGLAGQVTSGQVAQWANEIESNVEAAFDDKDIVRATATLIRFGKVTPGNLKPAMQVITDLATKTGSVDSAASLLSKALADPEKAAGKLARSGVVLTKVQQDQIKAFVKAGQTAKAQQFILDELSKTTKDAARNAVGPYGDALNTLSDAAEDAKRALAEGFLPVIQRAATWLKTKLADPKVIEDIRGFGKGLAGAFDKALTFAQEIPWDSVRSAMQMAGQGAKAALGFFQAMPPWVQTAILTGWGLNKLTGGAVGSLVGQLGSGLIKGVLGMNAGVVNINAAVVNGGGLPGGPLAPAAAGAGTALAATGVGTVAALGAFSAFAGVQANYDQFGKYGLTQPEIRAIKYSRMSEEEKATSARHGYPRQANQDLLLASALKKLEAATASPKPVVLGPPSPAYVGVLERATAKGLTPTASGIAATLAKNAATTKASADAAAARTTAAISAGGIATVLAIRALTGALASMKIAPKITVPVYVTSTVSVRDVNVAQRTTARYGNSNRIYEP